MRKVKYSDLNCHNKKADVISVLRDFKNLNKFLRPKTKVIQDMNFVEFLIDRIRNIPNRKDEFKSIAIEDKEVNNTFYFREHGIRIDEYLMPYSINNPHTKFEVVYMFFTNSYLITADDNKNTFDGGIEIYLDLNNFEILDENKNIENFVEYVKSFIKRTNLYRRNKKVLRNLIGE